MRIEKLGKKFKILKIVSFFGLLFLKFHFLSLDMEVEDESKHDGISFHPTMLSSVLSFCGVALFFRAVVHQPFHLDTRGGGKRDGFM